MGTPRPRERIARVTRRQSSGMEPPPPRPQRGPIRSKVCSAKGGMRQVRLLGEGDLGEQLCPKGRVVEAQRKGWLLGEGGQYGVKGKSKPSGKEGSGAGSEAGVKSMHS